MTQVSVNSIADTSGTATLTSGAATTYIMIPGAQAQHYVVEGYIDLSVMVSGDGLIITEDIEIDGSNYRSYNSQTFIASQSLPMLRLHGKLFGASVLYRVGLQLTATSGGTKAFPYWFTLQVLTA